MVIHIISTTVVCFQGNSARMVVAIKAGGYCTQRSFCMKRLTAVLILCAAAVWNIPAQQGDFEIKDGVLTWDGSGG
jgi:hypothetical protein